MDTISGGEEWADGEGKPLRLMLFYKNLELHWFF